MTTDSKKLLAWALGMLLLVITTASCSSTTGGASTGSMDESYNRSAYGDHWVYGENKHDPHARDYD